MFATVDKSIKNLTKLPVKYSELSPEELKQTLIVSNINDETEAFLSNLRISENREYCVQLMSIPEYQLC